MGPLAREHIRQCWGCDCDGKSHEAHVRPTGAPKAIVDESANMIEKLTGRRPPTCPWRAMYDPLVMPVIDAARLGKEGIGAVLTDDDAGILWDAVAVYLTAREAVRNHDDAEEHKKRIAELKKKGK